MTEELKPCPWCGCDPDGYEGRRVSCRCGAMGPIETSGDEAMGWNARAPVKVKPLQWWQSDTGDWIADTAVGRYHVQHGGESNPVWCCMKAMGVKHRPAAPFQPPSFHDTLEAAQEAGQADYERRIREALE